MIDNLFATPIYSCFLENKDIIQSEISNVLLNIQYDNSKLYDSWGKTLEITDVEVDIISDMGMTAISTAIDYHLKEYCREIDFQPREYRRTSWIAKTSTGGHTHVHTHGEADISGCYYFQTTGQDGNIFFTSPVSPATSSICYRKLIRKEYTPVVGKLLLFPGWLEHGVKTNTTDSERICLSFNISFIR